MPFLHVWYRYLLARKGAHDVDPAVSFAAAVCLDAGYWVVNRSTLTLDAMILVFTACVIGDIHNDLIDQSNR